MSDAAAPATAAAPPAFSPKVILALVLVGVVAFAGLAVLAAYAPDLRGGDDAPAHALSRSAIGYSGAPILMEKLGLQTVVSRTRPTVAQPVAEAAPEASSSDEESGDEPYAAAPVAGTRAYVLTPDGSEGAEALRPFVQSGRVLLVMPKWMVGRDPIRRGYVRKIGVYPRGDYDLLLKPYAKVTRVTPARTSSRPVLRAVNGPLGSGTYYRLGQIDRLQTVSGAGWAPILVDGAGSMVLARSTTHPNVWLLADPDLLNNHGLSDLNNARTGAAILQAFSDGGERGLTFDVTLNGYERGRGLWRTMLEPPWLAATLIGVMAAVLMGVHALARFGQPQRGGRAFALGARALVDNSADLVRTARREHELAPAYAALIRALVTRAAGGHAAEEHWLDHLAARRGATPPGELAAEAEQAATRDDLLAVARKLYDWRGEMTRERR